MRPLATATTAWSGLRGIIIADESPLLMYTITACATVNDDFSSLSCSDLPHFNQLAIS